MLNNFPEIVGIFPEADIPVDGLTARLAQGKGHQILFMEFTEDIDLPEHSHGAQGGIVLKGRIDLIVDGELKSYKTGDTYHIPEGVLHSAKIYAGYADVTVFSESDRYGIKLKKNE